MSCSCNCNPCNCNPAPVTCCTPTTESVEYTFENANVTGVGVFDNDTDDLVQFRGIVSDSASLTVTLDAGNKTILLSFDPEALVADIPDATTTQRGILETATNAEAIAKAATDKIVTPSNLAALGASTTFAGFVELATSAETITGTSTTLAVTPAGLAAASALYSTVTFADATARSGATPNFAGQFGAQLDTEQAYNAGSTVAGDWNGIFTFGASNVMSSGTSVDLNGSVLNLFGGSFNIDGTTTNTWSGNYAIDNAVFTFTNVATIDLDSAILKIGGVSVPANSVLVTSGSVGDPSSRLLNTFISSANTQTGYTTFSNPATLRTCDTATVTLQQLAQIVGTLIEDLKAVKLPAT